MMRADNCPQFTARLIGLAIRDYLMQKGEGYPNEFYRCWKLVKRKTSYNAVLGSFRVLERLGLIRVVREEKIGTKFPRKYYAIVPGMEDHEAWYNPRAFLYAQ